MTIDNVIDAENEIHAIVQTVNSSRQVTADLMPTP
jgi:hypothetical protein